MTGKKGPVTCKVDGNYAVPAGVALGTKNVEIKCEAVGDPAVWTLRKLEKDSLARTTRTNGSTERAPTGALSAFLENRQRLANRAAASLLNARCEIDDRGRRLGARRGLEHRGAGVGGLA